MARLTSWFPQHCTWPSTTFASPVFKCPDVTIIEVIPAQVMLPVPGAPST